MKNYYLFLLLFSMFIVSCQQQKHEDKVVDQGQSKESEKIDLTGVEIVPADKITESFGVFLEYYMTHIELFKDFKALDTNGKQITRINFLKKLNSGLYFPLALYSANDTSNYKLATIPKKADEVIKAYMIRFSEDQLAYCKLEGKPVPAFDFKDINGKHYTSENIKGKIVLFKCWFISCTACVKEMPALNEIVTKYKDRDDILFISLAMDTKPKLEQFLAKTKFDYATIPNQTKYMSDKLFITAYPTHVIINKKGELVRMLPDETKIVEAIEIELAK